MKLILATFVPLVCAASLVPSAFADETSPATLSGTVTLQVVSSKPAEAPANPQPAETLTVHVVRPSAAADDSEEAKQRDLETCGARWNDKLKAYRKELERTADYQTYFDTWKDSAAQRPPKLPIPVLTRASYRQCMAECLEGAAAGGICPGGWPEEKK